MDITSYLLGKKAGGGSGSTEMTAREWLAKRSCRGLFYYRSDGIPLLTDEQLLALFRSKEVTSEVTDMYGMFIDQTNITTVPLFDTSNVTNMMNMFSGCTSLINVPLFDTSNVTATAGMFMSCKALLSIPEFDTSNVTNMNSMFNNCYVLTTMPLLDTKNVTSMYYTFGYCKALTHIPELDLRNVTTLSKAFDYCTAITDLWVKNIKTALQVGSGTSYGHLLTVDSLINLIYELRDTGSTKTLTVGTANLEKLANVYVKLIEITDDMRAEDDLVDEKLPFVVCESTDEGAMLISEYVVEKNWTLK